MKKSIFKTIEENWKELLLFLMTWSIGWYLFFKVIGKIDPNISCDICPAHWMIFFTSLFLLFLPFVKKIEFGKIFKIEKEIKETKQELKDFKSDTFNNLNLISSNINLLSQNLSNNITIYNQAPDAETLREENEVLKNTQPNIKEETDKLKEEFKIVESEEEWIWVYNLLKLRIRIEKELREILSKRTSVKNATDLSGIKFYSIGKLFEIYLDMFPSSSHLLRSFKLFSSVANAAIHGQSINQSQYTEAVGLGTYVLGDIKIRQQIQP